ncbi:UBX domain-containing protein 6 isoform X4 [Cylas formicarius]|uniref:UBX domain-containing protein 6 isoform X4 n=1 Tax=Cylas formicarius TaxID=197179 RepID=UPI0029588097|nr:UBX domain-containing protein 6 isoform X4 [Cylas formicarius]XP_060536533.1 UBX domain-containing protein 6 isoform X4 [Cylas formicarius]
MAEKIKKFFQKKKADAKFKLAGPGHKLNESSSTSVVPPQKINTSVPKRGEPSDATRQAAEAALARLSSQRKDTPFNTSLAAIQAQVRRELEAEKKSADSNLPQLSVNSKQTQLETSSHLAVKGVYFKCPLVSDEVLPKEEWKVKIKEFLFEALEEERGITACLIIHSCNYSRTKVNDCVNILIRYIDNIIGNPTETKFHKIRCSNKTFTEKVLPILGATEFLYAAGFRQAKLEHDGVEEEFWLWSLENIEGMENLENLRDALKSENRVELELDRNLQVLSPAQAAVKIELPQDFYAISPEELKKEQQLRSEMAEKQLQLRTKAMKEKDELREIRKYKFSLIRIRFPDGLYLQGTFFVYEKYGDVIDFVKENLEHEGLPFLLASPTGLKLEEKDYDSSLAELRLVPATILIFEWDPSVSEEVKASGNITYLKPEVMMLMQTI